VGIYGRAYGRLDRGVFENPENFLEAVFTFSDLGAPVVMMGHLTPVAESVRDRTETLYRADGARLWRAIVGYAGDRVVADDAVSEAFTQLLRRGLAVQDASGGDGAPSTISPHRRHSWGPAAN